MFRRLVSCLALGAAVIAFPVAAWALPGDLDPTFDGDGRVITDLPGGSENVGAVVVQPDGKVVVAGGDMDFSRFVLLRYQTNGAPDPTFGGGDGIATTDISPGNDGAITLLLQPDGKLVAAGTAATDVNGNADFAVVRYLTDGTPDPDFGGGDGIVTTDFFGFFDIPLAMALQPDGKLVVVGAARDGVEAVMAVVRYLPGGALDPDFGGGDGFVLTDVDTDSFARAVALQPDGKIVVGGDSEIGPEFDIDFVLVRYLSDGTPDPDFGGGDGVEITVLTPSNDHLDALILQPDGTILAGGQADNAIALLRYLPSGSPDPGFGGGDGIVITDLPTDREAIASMVQQSNGKLVAAVDAEPSVGTSDFVVVRYLADGSLDPTFGTGGVVTTDMGGFDDFSFDVALMADGRIVALGIVGDASGDLFAIGLARYEGDPVPVDPDPDPGDGDDDDDYDYQDDDSDFDFDTPFDNSGNDTDGTDTGTDPGQQVAGAGDSQAPGAPADPGSALGDTAAPGSEAAPQAMSELPRTGLGTIGANTRAGLALITFGALALLAARRRNHQVAR